MGKFNRREGRTAPPRKTGGRSRSTGSKGSSSTYSRGSSKPRTGGRSFGTRPPQGSRSFSPNRSTGGRGARSTGGRGPKTFSPRRDNWKELIRVTCDKCGESCEVPFKPTKDKPVYCSDCYNKGEDFKAKTQTQELEQINEKLSKIMKALDIE